MNKWVIQSTQDKPTIIYIWSSSICDSNYTENYKKERIKK